MVRPYRRPCAERRGNVRDERRETTGQGAGAGRGVSVNITPEHRTRIHDIIIKERSAPRVGHVDFNVSIGTVVPRRSVRLVTSHARSSRSSRSGAATNTLWSVTRS
jgi:hypothetical protein